MAELLTTTDAALVVGVTAETMRRWADDKKVRHVRLPSGQVRFRREDIDALVLPVEPVAKETA